MGAPVLINAGRGGLQNEADILACLDDGTLGGASVRFRLTAAGGKPVLGPSEGRADAAQRRIPIRRDLEIRRAPDRTLRGRRHAGERGGSRAGVLGGLKFYRRPRERVRSREIGERLDRGAIAKAFEAGSIVISDKAAEESVAIGMAGEGTPGDTALGFRPIASAMRRLKRSTRPLVWGRYGLVSRCWIWWLAQMRSNGCLPEGLPSGLFFISTAKRSVNSEPLSVRMV